MGYPPLIWARGEAERTSQRRFAVFLCPTTKGRDESRPGRQGCLRHIRLLWRYVDQRAWVGVFQHPQRAIGSFFDIANAFADVPALGGFGAAMAVHDDAVKRRRPQTADEGVAVPLRERLLAGIEHNV